MTSDGKVGLLRGNRAPKTQAARHTGLGPPLDLTESELDHAADVTPVDVAAAKGLWIHAVPQALKDLLDATAD